MSAPMRSVKLSSGHTLEVWDANTWARTGQHQLRYEFKAPRIGVIDHDLAAPLFEGADYGVAPMDSIDSDAALLGLLSYLTLRPGDTDSDYFAEYTDAQMAWARSSTCEYLAYEVSTAEEVGGCACGRIWTNLDRWECDDDLRGNVAEFQVIDHGEDGSAYFPGCATAHTKYANVATGVGDTAEEALDDALEQMATDELEARPSKLQEDDMKRSLNQPSDKSAFDSLDHSECGEDHDGDDWHHYVSVRYNVREGA